MNPSIQINVQCTHICESFLYYRKLQCHRLVILIFDFFLTKQIPLLFLSFPSNFVFLTSSKKLNLFHDICIICLVKILMKWFNSCYILFLFVYRNRLGNVPPDLSTDSTTRMKGESRQLSPESFCPHFVFYLMRLLVPIPLA